MSGPGLFRSRLSEAKSPVRSRSRNNSSGRSSSSTRLAAPPPPDRGRRNPPRTTILSPPPLQSRRSQSHESTDRRSSAAFRSPDRRDGYFDADSSEKKLMRRSSSQRQGYSSPKERSEAASPRRSVRPPLTTWGRRSSANSPGREARPISPPRSPRERRSSLDYGHGDEYGGGHERSERRGRPSSVSRQNTRPKRFEDYQSSKSPPSRSSAAAASRVDRRNENRRSETPSRYKPNSDTGKYSAPHSSPPYNPQTGGRDNSEAFFSKLPGRFASYAGFHSLTETASKAKDWVDYLTGLNDTPSEIHDLSAKTCTARDTINQIQQSIIARPDLLEGESGERLKDQIEETCHSADQVLQKMTRILTGLSQAGAQQGTLRQGLEGYWKSWRYRDEFEATIRELDAELQAQLQQLSLLMINVYSRALRKPSPPGSTAVPPPVPLSTEATTEAAHPIPTRPKAPTPEGREPETSDRNLKGDDENKPPTATGSPPSDPIVPTIEVQPPTQSTDDYLNDGACYEHTPLSTGLGSSEYENFSPLLTPDKENPSSDCDDDNQTVGNGLLPLAEDKVPVVKDVPTPTQSVPPLGNQDAPAKERAHATTPSANAAPTGYNKEPSRSTTSPILGVSPEDVQRQAKEQLLDAAWDGDFEKVTTCLCHVPPTITDSHGLTPLHLACERDNLAIAILLLDRGSPGSPQSSRGITPLHLASRYATSSSVEMLLERARVDANLQTLDGKTALHFAASVASDEDGERREVVKVLRDWGANPFMVDCKRETPRDVAQSRGFWKIAGTLKRMERRWEEEHPERDGSIKGERLGQSHSGGSSASKEHDRLSHQDSVHKHGSATREDDKGKKSSWLRRHGFMR